MSSNDSSEVLQNHLNGFSAITLAVFIVASVFVIWPVRIKVLPFVQRPFLWILKACRIIDAEDHAKYRRQQLYFPLSLKTSPLIAVLLLLATTAINGSTIRLGVKGDDSVKPYDVLVLFISLAYISIALDSTGAIEASVFWVSQRGGTSGFRLFTYLYLFFLGVGCIVGNDPLILSGTPFLAYFKHHTGVAHAPWVFSEFMAANTASAVLVSSNPTNVLITGSFNLNYLTQFTKWTILPSIIPAILNYPVLLAMFWRQIPKTLVTLKGNPKEKLKDPLGAVYFSTLMVVTVGVLVGTSFVPGGAVQVWMVTAPAGAIALLFDLGSDWFRYSQRQLIRRSSVSDPAAAAGPAEDAATTTSNDPTEVDQSLNKKTFADDPSPLSSTQTSPHPTTLESKEKGAASDRPTTLLSLLRTFDRRFPGTSRTIMRLPIPLLPFAICEFILVRGLAQRGWIHVFAQGFSNACTTPLATVFFFGFVCAAFLCPLAGTNIGATIILVEILRDSGFAQSPHVVAEPRILLAGIYAVALGSNLGAFSYTFAGSLAGLLWKGLLADKDIVIRQRDFAMYNFLPLVIQTTVACAIIYGQLYWFDPGGQGLSGVA